MKLGKVSENIIKRSVIGQGGKYGAVRKKDCALFTGYTANEALGCAGAHAIIRAVNRAAEAGYKPKSASLTVTMPEYMREKRLKEIMASAREEAARHGIEIEGGHSETVAGITYPIITAVVSATNAYVADAAEAGKDAAPAGMTVVMTKWIGLAGSAWIAMEHGEGPAARYPEFILEDGYEQEKMLCIETEADIARELGDRYMYACGDGGIFAGLWKLADRLGTGIEAELGAIPVRQETIELCEYYGVNPYKLRSDGALLIATKDPDKLIEKLNERNIYAAAIGRLTEGNDRVILAGEERRFLEEPTRDEQVEIMCYNVQGCKHIQEG